MILLHNIGQRHNSNYNNRREIESCPFPLSFDGIYRNVWWNQDVLAGKDVILFVMGAYVGKDNSFDVGQPREEYCTWEEIMYMVNTYGFHLGWHTWTHPSLVHLSDEQVIKEITPPFPMKYFAYPYGDVDARVAKLVEKAGYESAWSVTQGDGSTFQKRRQYLNW